MSSTCKKAVTFLAENSGIIAALTQQQILTGDPDYALSRIPEAPYDVNKGHSPRYVRVRTTPPRRVHYSAMLPTGNTTFSVPNPATGTATTVTGDKTGRGCALPAETLQYGYDVKNRCLKGKALEAGPWCVMDLLEKEAFKPLLATLWRDLPRYAKEDFGRQLLRDVIEFSYYKFSIDEGFPMSVNHNYFPTIPTGGPSIGFIRKIENLLNAQGWAKGANTPMINGRSSLQVRMSREAIEWAIVQRKKELDLKLESTIYADDSTFGKTVIYEGIQFIEAQLATRGYLRTIGVGLYEFVEVDPTIVTTADGEGFWPVPNNDYYNSYVVDGGVRYRMCEIGYIIHPTAMERQSLGAIPSVPGKTFSRNFDFEVNPIPDYELADKGCNKDQFWFGYRMLHAYAPLPKNPELMTAFIYLAPTNRYEITDPWADLGVALANPLSLAPLTDPQNNNCVPCAALGDLPRDPASGDCSDLFPANGVGVIRQAQTAYSVEEHAGNLTIVVNRVGGSTGAAGVSYGTTAGTAIAGQNYTTTTGTLSWLDGEYGPKSFNVPILVHAGDDSGKQFTVVLSSATGATLGTATATVTILDTDAA